jgi:hypothetical protein
MSHSMNLLEMSDAQLAEIRKSLPKYRNESTPEQQALGDAVYQEQKRRYDEALAQDYAQYNREVEAAGYRVGDRVSYFARSMIGFGGIVVKGTVQKRKKYYVKLDHTFQGQKSAHLTKSWRREE